jgi:hypothetical protein
MGGFVTGVIARMPPLGVSAGTASEPAHEQALARLRALSLLRQRNGLFSVRMKTRIGRVAGRREGRD